MAHGYKSNDRSVPQVSIAISGSLAYEVHISVSSPNIHHELELVSLTSNSSDYFGECLVPAPHVRRDPVKW